jgi:hypothetical protein
MAVEQVIKISLDDLKALGGIDNLKKSLGETESSTKSLKQQLKEATAEVAQMAEKYGEASKETVQAAKRAAELKDRIEDANDAIMAFKGEGAFLATGKALQSVASGFAAAQGAMGLFGSESENVEKAILKVQSAMALAQGLEGLEDAGRAFTQLKTVAGDAFNAIKGAIGGIGIGLLVIALGTLVAKWDDVSEALSGASKEQDLFNKLQKEAISQSAKEIQDLDILYRTSQNHALSLEERKRAVDKLQSIYPNYFANIQDEIILNGGAVKSYQNLRLAILDAARAKAAQSELDKRAQERLQKELDLQERLNKQLEIYRNPKAVQNISIGSTGGTGSITSAQTVKSDAKMAAFALIQEQKKLREDAQKEDALLLGIIQKGSNTLGKASENKGKEIVQGLRRGMTNSNDVTANRATVQEKVETTKLEETPELVRERMIADARKLMDKELTDAKIEEENKRVQAVVDANNKIGENSLMLNEWEKELNQQRIQERYEMLDNLAYIFGAESDLGKAALIAKQVLAAKELALEISKTITFAATTEAKAVASIAAGTAETAKIGFPQNIPMLIGYAAQAAAIIMSVKSAVGKVKGAAKVGGGSSISGGVGATPTPRPQFNVAGDAGVNQIASTLANQQPIKAYVVGKEVSTQQSLDRNIVKNATLG